MTMLTPDLKAFMAPDLSEADGVPAPTTDGIIARMFLNFRMVRSIARDFGIKVLFVIQPVPFFEYSPDAGNYPFTPDPSEFAAITNGYKRLGQMIQELQEEDPAATLDVLWLGSLFEDEKGPVYLDQVHYTRAAGKRIAAEIGKRLRE